MNDNGRPNYCPIENILVLTHPAKDGNDISIHIDILLPISANRYFLVYNIGKSFLFFIDVNNLLLIIIIEIYIFFYNLY